MILMWIEKLLAKDLHIFKGEKKKVLDSMTKEQSRGLSVRLLKETEREY